MFTGDNVGFPSKMAINSCSALVISFKPGNALSNLFRVSIYSLFLNSFRLLKMEFLAAIKNTSLKSCADCKSCREMDLRTAAAHSITDDLRSIAGGWAFPLRIDVRTGVYDIR